MHFIGCNSIYDGWMERCCGFYTIYIAIKTNKRQDPTVVCLLIDSPFVNFPSLELEEVFDLPSFRSTSRCFCSLMVSSFTLNVTDSD